MTSTQFNVGLTDNTRLSSRVLRPPGGGHTDIFGGEPEPQRGRRAAPSVIAAQQAAAELQKQTNGIEDATQNGQAAQPEQQAAEPQTPPEPKPSPEPISTPEPKVDSPTKPAPQAQETAKVEPPRRVRVPPGGFSSGLCYPVRFPERRRRGMEGGRQSRLLSRLLGKLRGEHRYSTLDKNLSFISTVESTGCSTANEDEDLEAPTMTSTSTSSAPMDDDQFAANIDLRYGGQYLTPEQLPEFCDQLHHLVEIVRNIQSYSQITGEYPSELERRLEQEAREVASLAAEARNARDVVNRTRAQRRAVRAFKKHLVGHLATLRETEVRELESNVRLSDRKLFKNWESLKDSSDPSVFDPLLEEIRLKPGRLSEVRCVSRYGSPVLLEQQSKEMKPNKQTALECLVRLIESRKSAIGRAAPSPQPLPPPMPRENEESTTATGRRRQDNRRSSNKRRRKDCAREPRSVPLSNENSRHTPPPQVTLFIGGQAAPRCRVNSAGAVALTPLDLPSRGSVRDILFFTTN